MVVAFIWSNGVIYENSLGNHYSRSYTEEYCSRFLSVADKVIFFTRIEKCDKTDGLTNMDKMAIEYHACINPMSIEGLLKRKLNYSKLENIFSCKTP